MGEFTAHNILMPDGTRTIPDHDLLLAERELMKGALRILRLVYGEKIKGKSIVDLGCLEGGYTLEFARAGMEAVGIEVRQSNFENCLTVKAAFDLPNLNFVMDDCWTYGRLGPFDATFCCGLLYHLDRPRAFIRLMAEHTRDVIIINTHYASHADEDGAQFKLSPLTSHEGLEGRWFAEHEIEDRDLLDKAKWTSWENRRSFWLTKPAIVKCLQENGFALILEQYDIWAPDILNEMTRGPYATFQRTVLVGIRQRET